MACAPGRGALAQPPQGRGESGGFQPIAEKHLRSGRRAASGSAFGWSAGLSSLLQIMCIRSSNIS